MGSSPIKNKDYILDNHEIVENGFFDAYKSMKEIILLLNNFEEVSINAYLISVNTIPNFINIIKSLNILDFLKTKNNELNELESKLNDCLKNYKLEKEIKIINNFKDCNNLPNNDNEFIIVDELFCRVMKIDQYYEENKKVNIYIDEKKFKYEIRFYSNEIIDFREQQNTGFYKFLYEKN